jgi:intracellular sulfur oxidation DsrE/DsrF family protein
MSIPKDKVLISLVVSNDQIETLKAIAKREDCSVSSLVRKGIKFIINKYSTPITSVSNSETPDDYLLSVLDALSSLNDS